MTTSSALLLLAAVLSLAPLAQVAWALWFRSGGVKVRVVIMAAAELFAAAVATLAALSVSTSQRLASWVVIWVICWVVSAGIICVIALFKGEPRRKAETTQ